MVRLNNRIVSEADHDLHRLGLIDFTYDPETDTFSCQLRHLDG